MQDNLGPLPPSLIAPGAMLAGKYRVERVLGEGGMGVVVAAHHVVLDQRVALKLLRVAAADRPDIVERFVREARSAVRLRSQHVARVLDVGTLDTGIPYIVLEYLEGADLDAILRKSGPMPYARAIALALQACEAVAEAHALGIIHRDIKPHNLFVTTGIGGSDLLKVLDFGIAKSGAFAAQGILTRSDSSVGSPLYMSPEQMRSPRDVDHRTDIWALGITLYELIAGCPPFDAESFPELVLKVQEGRITPLSAVRPDVPPALAEAIARCLRRDPAERYATVAALATALEPFTWPEARAAAENARRALGVSPSTPAVPMPTPMPMPGSQPPAPPVPVTTRSGSTPAPSPPNPTIGAARSHPSGPNAWTESIAKTGSIPPRSNVNVLAAAFALGLLVIFGTAIGGLLLWRKHVANANASAPSATATATASVTSTPVATATPPIESAAVIPDPIASGAASASASALPTASSPSAAAAAAAAAKRKPHVPGLPLKPSEKAPSPLDGVPDER